MHSSGVHSYMRDTLPWQTRHHEHTHTLSARLRMCLLGTAQNVPVGEAVGLATVRLIRLGQSLV